jgi:hypothetical protein
MQTYDEGREGEAQENGQRDWNEKFPAKIERSDDQGGDGHICQHRASSLCQPNLSGLLLQLHSPYCQQIPDTSLHGTDISPKICSSENRALQLTISGACIPSWFDRMS